jgi:MarR family transcriptional regulator, organic hydroperoxide resistance regulator
MSNKYLIQDIMVLQHKLHQIYIKNNLKHWLESDLTKVQLKFLMYVVQKHNVTSKNLASTLGVTPSNVTGIIDRLISRKLVQKEESPKDRRFSILSATDKGKELITVFERKTSERMEKLLNNLEDDELEHVYQGLSVVYRVTENAMNNKITNNQGNTNL